MTKGQWPSAPEDAVSMELANIYIDNSGSMDGKPLRRAVAWLTEVWGNPNTEPINWRNAYTFNSVGVRPFDPASSDQGYGGDGLASALEHARRQRKRAVVISDGGHDGRAKAGAWAWVNVSDDPYTPKPPPSVRYDVIAPEGMSVEAAFGPLLTAPPAQRIAARMAEASRRAADSPLEGAPEGILWMPRAALTEERELLAEAVVAAYHSDPTKADEERRPPGVKLARAIVAEKREREAKEEWHAVECAVVDLRSIDFDFLVSALSVLPERPFVPDAQRLIERFTEAARTVLDYIEKDV